MDGMIALRIAIVGLGATALLATAAGFGLRNEVPPLGLPRPVLIEPEADPIREDLLRCRLLGEAALHDQRCLAAWAAARDRFLGQAPHMPTAPQAQPSERR